MDTMITGVSGLESSQQALNVIANNIANLNTFGFKSGLANFQDTLVDTLNAGEDTGVNPTQIGTGVTLTEWMTT